MAKAARTRLIAGRWPRALVGLSPTRSHLFFCLASDWSVYLHIIEHWTIALGNRRPTVTWEFDVNLLCSCLLVLTAITFVPTEEWSCRYRSRCSPLHDTRFMDDVGVSAASSSGEQ